MKQNKNTFINPPTLFDASQNGFSHLGLKSKDSELAFILGQWASNKSGELAVEEFGGQVKATIENLKKALSAVNLTEKDIIKLTVYIADYMSQKNQKAVTITNGWAITRDRCFSYECNRTSFSNGNPPPITY
jgi:hypothetical protein